MGKYHGRDRSVPEKAGRVRVWLDAAVDHNRVRDEGGQDRSRRGVPRSASDERVQILPVLDPNGRPRRGSLPKVFYVSIERGNHAIGEIARRETRSAGSAQDAGQSGD